MESHHINRWSEFRDCVQAERAVIPIYWRGVRDPELPLASSFERIILEHFGGWRKTASRIYPYEGRYQQNSGKPIWEPGYYQGTRDRYLSAFISAVSGLRGPNPKDLCPDQWWALGRHYGLITPLLDWSEKPYIAAFFALTGLWRKMNERGQTAFDGKACAVYRLFRSDDLQGDGLRVVEVKVEELGRLQGQRGVFTWLDSEKYFELQGFLDDTGKGHLLTRFIISDQAVMDGLRDLRDYGVDYRTLYPDLYGAAKHANVQFSDPF